jgi:membrane protein DedA with SNARE-associated domain
MDLLSIVDTLRAPLDAYRWLVRESVTLARDLFEQYGYLVIFLGTSLENTLFLGLFIPGILIIILAGISAYQGLIAWPLAFLIGVIGTSLGDTVSYLAARYGWKRALHHTEKMLWMGTMRSALLRHTGVFVLAYHFMGYTRLVGPITAGALRIPFLRWWLLDFLGAVIWVAVYLAAGMLFGRLGFTLDSAEENIRKLEWLFAGLAVVGVAVALYARRRGEKRPPVLAEALADEAVVETEEQREDEQREPDVLPRR